MSRIRIVAVAALGLMLGATVGCGDSRYAPVSGTVRVDGEPYANAAVFFQPEGTKDNSAPGRGSSGVTDANGRYSLKTTDGITGAVIGKNQVKIVTNSADVVGFDPSTGSRDDVPGPAKGKIDPIPPDWRNLGGHTYEVPPGGTDKADFDITPVTKKTK